jgi:hypothetical protein
MNHLFKKKYLYNIVNGRCCIFNVIQNVMWVKVILVNNH